jgi:hypothetical protein
MSTLRYLPIPAFIAFQAFTMMLLAPYIPGNAEKISGGGFITWIAFQAWAMYFLAGCTPRKGVETFLGYIGGIAASIGIFELWAIFKGLDAAKTPWGLYLAVFVVVVAVICFEKVPWMNFIPAWFVGAGVFFALMTLGQEPIKDYTTCSKYGVFTKVELIACIGGLLFGWITVTFRVWYEGKFMPKKTA